MNATQTEAQPIMRRLEFYFACLTVLGGLVLTVGNQGPAIPVIAILFAIIGYVFVDLLRIMALPPTLAYLAMGLAAALCIADFAIPGASGSSRLVAVAQLLVLVQAILMMQAKTKRILEQLGIFCLLELIVAAVFNQSLAFGLLLIPITVIGGLALGLLSALHVVGPANPESSFVSTSARESAGRVAAAAHRRSLVALLISGPAVLLIASACFYGLPRLVEAPRANASAPNLIGFSDQVRLDRMGQMLQNPQIALRVSLTDPTSLNPYRVDGGIYLRGKVLENYVQVVDGARVTAGWVAGDREVSAGDGRLPSEFVPLDDVERNSFDPVVVTIDCNAMRLPELFAIPPYYQREDNPRVVHDRADWTLRRAADSSIAYEPIEYRFGTHAFHDGVQTDLLADLYPGGATALLEFDRREMPKLAELADRLVAEQPSIQGNAYSIGKLLERHLATSDEYRYTLSPRLSAGPSLDPIEAFIATDREGHCQYFASALAMMLRSQNIPARLVVGYFTDERSPWSAEFIARESHAHAWVEARVDAEQLPDRRGLAGQPPASAYWVRLDPTPPAAIGTAQPGAMRQSFDLAEHLWEDYVLTTDALRDGDSVRSMTEPSGGSWSDHTAGWLRQTMEHLESAAVASRFTSESWRIPGNAMWLGALALMVALMSCGWIWVRRVGLRAGTHRHEATPRPSVDFYAQTLDQLARMGLRRDPAQTPAEFAAWTVRQLRPADATAIEPPLVRLTDAFYRQRFGGSAGGNDDTSLARVPADLSDLTIAVDQLLDREKGADPLDTSLTHESTERSQRVGALFQQATRARRDQQEIDKRDRDD